MFKRVWLTRLARQGRLSAREGSAFCGHTGQGQRGQWLLPYAVPFQEPWAGLSS